MTTSTGNFVINWRLEVCGSLVLCDTVGHVAQEAVVDTLVARTAGEVTIVARGPAIHTGVVHTLAHGTF